LMGSESGMIIGIGQRVHVKLTEAAPVTGGIALELLSIEGRDLPKGPPGSRGKPPKRALVKAKRKGAKLKQKADRRR